MGRRVAFLIGNQTFRADSGLAPLRGPLNDVAALAEIFGDPEWGGFEIRRYPDASSGEIKEAIEEELGKTGHGDLVLIAYAGHGTLDPSGRLCLATSDTRSAAIQATSIPARHLREIIESSNCDAVVLLLDCCYSGAAADTRGSVEDQLRSLQEASGLYILTASSAIQTARETEAVINGVVMGQFTTALVQGIRSGVADYDTDGEIRLRDLVRHVQSTIRHQTPQFLAARANGDPLISYSPDTDSSLPPEFAEIYEALHAEAPVVRIGAAWRLGHMTRDAKNERLAARVRIWTSKRLRGKDSERDPLVREALMETQQVVREIRDWKPDDTEVPDLGINADRLNITGVWQCNDGGVYYIRNLGSEVWWYGYGVHPHQSFYNVAYGRVEGEDDASILKLRWADIPKGTTNIWGRLVLRLNYAIQYGRVTHMSLAERSGNFGGSLWTWLRQWDDPQDGPETQRREAFGVSEPADQKAGDKRAITARSRKK